MLYYIYALTFLSRRGTRREYIGYTRSVDARVAFHKQWPTPFAKPSGTDFHVRTLEEGIASKECALALEALHAARAILKTPATARGGPWASPKPLSASAMGDVGAVAQCRSLLAIDALAQQNRRGALYRHLKDLVFDRPEEAAVGEPVVRGAVVRRRVRSGTPGNACRKKQILQGKLKSGSLQHRRLHRGRDPAARRGVETARRKR